MKEISPFDCFLIFMLFILIIVLICSKSGFFEGFSQLTNPPLLGSLPNPANISPGTVVAISAGNWQFIPSPGFYGQTKITYNLSDGSGNPPATDYAIINVTHTFNPIIATNPTITPNQITATPGTVPNYQFHGFDLLAMLGLSGGENGANINNMSIIINSFSQVYKNLPSAVPGGTLTMFQGSSSTPVVPIPITQLNSSSAIIGASLPETTLFSYNSPQNNLDYINVSIQFCIVDNTNFQMTAIPGGPIYGFSGPFTLQFQIPITYNYPIPIPVTLSVNENGILPLSSSTLVNGTTAVPGFGYTISPIGPFSVSSPTCAPGYFMNAGSCSSCSAGTFSLGGTSSCSSCPANSAAASCTTCPGGYTSIVGSGSCSACPANYYSTSGNSCQQCPANQQSSSGSSSCTNCPANFQSDNGGACTPCQAGFSSISGGNCFPIIYLGIPASSGTAMSSYFVWNSGKSDLVSGGTTSNAVQFQMLSNSSGFFALYGGGSYLTVGLGGIITSSFSPDYSWSVNTGSGALTYNGNSNNCGFNGSYAACSSAVTTPLMVQNYLFQNI